jgi:hypothetical protein
VRVVTVETCNPQALWALVVFILLDLDFVVRNNAKVVRAATEYTEKEVRLALLGNLDHLTFMIDEDDLVNPVNKKANRPRKHAEATRLHMATQMDLAALAGGHEYAVYPEKIEDFAKLVADTGVKEGLVTNPVELEIDPGTAEGVLEIKQDSSLVGGGGAAILVTAGSEGDWDLGIASVFDDDLIVLCTRRRGNCLDAEIRITLIGR